ncbi:MAG TPA: ATP-binding protein [Streptomyces sp.]|nr:ATP-binding protein [Streptomyces sp.]
MTAAMQECLAMGTEGPPVLDRLWRDFPPLDPGSLSGSVSCALPPRHEAVRTARDFSGTALARWQLTEHIDNVALVISELVTNALRHGLPSAVPGGPNPPVRLHLMHWSSRLVCAVRDPSRKAPVAGAPRLTPDFTGLAELADTIALTGPQGPAGPEGTDGLDELAGFGGLDHTAESGRGLFLVESLSDGWGWQPVDDPAPGKVVWALFRLNPGRGTGVSPVRGDRTRRP